MDADTEVIGTVYQVRCCCAVLLFIVLIRVQNGKPIQATIHFAVGDLVLKRWTTRPTHGSFYVLRLGALMFNCQILHARKRGGRNKEEQSATIQLVYCPFRVGGSGALHGQFPATLGTDPQERLFPVYRYKQRPRGQQLLKTRQAKGNMQGVQRATTEGISSQIFPSVTLQFAFFFCVSRVRITLRRSVM